MPSDEMLWAPLTPNPLSYAAPLCSAAGQGKETKSKIPGIDEAEMSGRRCWRSGMLVFLPRVEEERHSCKLPFSALPGSLRGRPSAWKASFQHSSAFRAPTGQEATAPQPPRTSQLALSFSLIPRDPQGQRKGAGRGVSSVACGRGGQRAESQECHPVGSLSFSPGRECLSKRNRPTKTAKHTKPPF